MRNLFKNLALFTATFLLSGCMGTTTAITKRNLTVENQMSATVFLEPVAEEQQTVYVQVRNTSGQNGFNLTENIKTGLQSKGYRVVSAPDKAHYLLQVNVLNAGEMSKQTKDDLMAAGFGGALSGGLVGAGAGALMGGHRDAMIAGTLAGAALGVLIDATVRDVTYAATADIQISERLAGGATSTAQSTGTLKQGTQSTVHYKQNSQTPWQRYQTRLVSSANKVNLSAEQATPLLAKGMSDAIVGIF